MTEATERALDYLLTLARVWISPPSGGREQRSTLGWPAHLAVAEEVERLARIHGLLPWLHAMGERYPATLPPDGARRTAWERERFETFAFQSALYDLLAQVVAGCRAAGCPVVVLKGPAAAARVWGDVGLRPTSDLDLLCHRQDLRRVTRVVRAAGLAAEAHSATYHMTFRGERPGHVIELHFGLYDFLEKPAFLEALWRSIVDIDLDGREVPASSEEVALAFGLAHWIHHDGRLGLPQLMELAAAVWRGGVAAGEAADLLAETAFAAEAALCVRTLGRLFSLPPAPAALAAPAGTEAHDREFELYVRGNLCQPEEARELPSPLAETLARSGWHLVTHAVRLAFPPLVELQALYGCGWAGALARRPAHFWLAARRAIAKLRARRHPVVAAAAEPATAPSVKREVYRRR